MKPLSSKWLLAAVFARSVVAAHGCSARSAVPAAPPDRACEIYLDWLTRRAFVFSR